MDSKFSVINESEPFDFSWVPPSTGSTNDLPLAENYFYYNMVGGAGFIGFSSAHTNPAAWFEEACSYFVNSPEGKQAHFVFLLGHWNDPMDSCAPGMEFPTLFNDMKNLATYPLCSALQQSGRFHYITGHEHGNKKISADGVLVGGQGSQGSGLWGFPMFEIQEPYLSNGRYMTSLNITYFPLATYGSKTVPDENALTRYATLTKCIETSGSIFNCKHLGESWMSLALPATGYTSSPTAPTTGASTRLPTSNAPTPPAVAALGAADPAVLGIALGVVFGLLFLIVFLIAMVWYYRKSKAANKKNDDLEERTGLLRKEDYKEEAVAGT